MRLLRPKLLRLAALVAGFALSAVFSVVALGAQAQPHANSFPLLVTVVDENGVPVPAARVVLTPVASGSVPVLAPAAAPGVLRGETDYAGRRRFTGLAPGHYQLRVEKEAFYAVALGDVRPEETESTEVTLTHQREFYEHVDVVASPANIDPAQTRSSHDLESNQIINLPFTVPRDIRYALPMIPGVLQDSTGQVHVDGSSTRMVEDVLDGFNITDPVTGFFDLRVNVDALRSVAVDSSRFPAEDGKASGGVVSLSTGMGDDKLRFSGTDFVPSLANRKGWHVTGWTPRASFTGPLQRGKAWFLIAPEGDWNLNIVNELPPGADEQRAWRAGNLAKAQVNLTSNNILSGSFLVNEYHSHHAGLSAFNPLPATPNLSESVYFTALKDQMLLENGALVEAGLAYSRFRSGEHPLGTATYVITPDTTGGNYFENAEGRAERWQWITNVIMPPWHGWGRHDFKLGIDLDRLTDRQSFHRNDVTILREDNTLSRRLDFPGQPSFAEENTETGLYAQDHWSVSERLLIDPGVRFDWDQIVHRTQVSPRLAASFMPTAKGDTKLVAGVGLYYDASNLDLLTRPLDGQRIDLFYDSTGTTLLRPPVNDVFELNQNALRQGRFLNWSAGVERRLRPSTYLRTEFVEKRGANEWTYLNPCSGPAGCFSGIFTLANARRDKYDAVEVTARHTFKQGHVMLLSYTRSASRSNAVLNYSVTNLYFSPQAGGPLPWDTPNRLVTWGLVPVWKGFDFAYTADWHDGFPFSAVNQDQELQGKPQSYRFPHYFALNAALEKRLDLFGFEWALRAGFNDITDRHNPYAVDNNTDSPHFLRCSWADGRAAVAELRLIGRK